MDTPDGRPAGATEDAGAESGLDELDSRLNGAFDGATQSRGGGRPRPAAMGGGEEPAEKARVEPEKTETPEPEPEEPEAEEEEPFEGLPPKVQEKVDRRIAKLTAKRKQAEERAAAAEAKAAEAESKATGAEKTLAGKTLEEAYRMGIAPEYLSEDERKVLARDGELADAEGWLLENFDGYEGSGTPEDPSYSKEQIRKRYAQVSSERRSVAGRAAGLREERTRLMLEDMRAGREARIRGKKPGEEGKATGTPKPKVEIPPAAIPKGSAGAGRAPVSAGKPRTGFDQARVFADASPEALERELAKVL